MGNEGAIHVLPLVSEFTAIGKAPVWPRQDMKASTVLSQQGQRIQKRSKAPLPTLCFTLPDIHCFSGIREECRETGPSIFFDHSILCLAAETANKRPCLAQQWQGVSALHARCDETSNWHQRGTEQAWEGPALWRVSPELVNKESEDTSRGSR